MSTTELEIPVDCTGNFRLSFFNHWLALDNRGIPDDCPGSIRSGVFDRKPLSFPPDLISGNG
jgi:hypothetical protein